MTQPNPKPVVALDVDGVLNIFPPFGPLRPGWQRFDVTLHADRWPNGWHLRRLRGDTEQITLTMNPVLHGGWITDLRRRANVVWATTWESAANDYIAPILGIEPLPLGVSTETTGGRMSEDSSMWKARALAPTRAPLVWVDDLNDRYRRKWGGRGHPAKLVVTTDERVGLTQSQMDRIDQFVEEHS